MAAKIENLFKKKPRQILLPGLFFHREDKKIWVIFLRFRKDKKFNAKNQTFPDNYQGKRFKELWNKD
ncbi:MAG TPA: hypothetical protein ENN90_15325 [Mariniphaga anaerophila]|uniref:Uncharacterized protein n=1 Tax=Mariniphaga anaerophila TaxID=1484053 RepID=A0A831LU41_9BACT|nr:hypothetical protein [Mariniphaga anaerophila]